MKTLPETMQLPAYPLLILFCLTMMTSAPAVASPLEKLATFDSTEYRLIESKAVGRPFHIFVRLPDQYDKSDAIYPVVYLLDGDVTYPLFAAYQPLIEFDAPEIPVPIIVGVAYGSFDPENGNHRRTDYTTPSAEDPDGGAAAFQKFLKSELIPMIETEYRAASDRRILVGQSRGGHFVLYSALTEPDLFWGHIASNPAFSPAKDFFVERGALPASGESSLYFSSGSDDIPELRADALEWMAAWSEHADKPWRLKSVTLEGETHATGILNVYRAGMKWLFEAETSSQGAREH